MPTERMHYVINFVLSEISTKIMAFKGKHLVRSKIEIDGSILEQVKQFKYLGCELSLDGERDFDKRMNRFQGICGTIRKRLKEPRTDTGMGMLILNIGAKRGRVVNFTPWSL